MTDLKIVHEWSLCKPLLSPQRQQLNQLDELAQSVQVKSSRRVAEPLMGTGRCTVSPVHGHCKTAVLGIAQDQRVNTSDASLLENDKAPAP